jgi:acyl-CoA synthetase (AMP-forming)/AMP-acid ligase II
VIEAQVDRTPRAPAVEFQGDALTYLALNERANRLARRLLDLTRPGGRVCVLLDRSPDQVVVWLAALKSGRIYAPIDPSNPAERLCFYLQDIDPAVILTHHELRSLLPSTSVQILTLDDPEERSRQELLDSTNLPTGPDAQTAINLLYTSGSTGIPKAAINGMEGLGNFASEVRRTFDLGPHDRVLQSSATSFDA